jgi:CDGSH-type Zn-finger protein
MRALIESPENCTQKRETPMSEKKNIHSTPFCDGAHKAAGFEAE